MAEAVVVVDCQNQSLNRLHYTSWTRVASFGIVLLVVLSPAVGRSSGPTTLHCYEVPRSTQRRRLLTMPFKKYNTPGSRGTTSLVMGIGVKEGNVGMFS